MPGCNAEVRDLTCEDAALASRVEWLEVDHRQAALDPQRPVEGAGTPAGASGRSSSGTGRKRGELRGAAGHGRIKRLGLGRTQLLRARAEEATSRPAGGPASIIRIVDGQADAAMIGELMRRPSSRSTPRPTRTPIVRSRWRRSCECASSPSGGGRAAGRRGCSTPRFLRDPRLACACHYGDASTCRRTLHRVASWPTAMGLAIAQVLNNLAGSIKRFAPLFEPLRRGDPRAIRIEAALSHADGTCMSRSQAYRRRRGARAGHPCGPR